MFLGTSEHVIDGQGTIALPVRFHRLLHERIVLTRGFDRCLQAFPDTLWQLLSHRISGLSLGHTDARHVRRFIFADAVELEINHTGRLNVPASLRVYAGLREAVVFVGMDTFFEVWSLENWSHLQQTFQQNIKTRTFALPLIPLSRG